MNLSVCSCGKHDSNLAFGIQEWPIIQGDVGWGATGLAWMWEPGGGHGWKRREKQPSEIWEKRQLGAAAGSSWRELPLPRRIQVGSEQLRCCSPCQGCCWGGPSLRPNTFSPLSGATKAGSSLCAPSRAVLSRTIPRSGIKQQRVNHLLLRLQHPERSCWVGKRILI